ncbi:hypothetical protein SN4111_14820 [Ligilactobacillus agilis]|nr:hypothetical protein SN4111_14820 [Ligilactobacillus agilis]
MKNIDINILQLAQGAVQEKLDQEFEKIFENIQDPNPVLLAPYRTFIEVKQPENKFIFRMKDGPRGAIFEADGGAWRNQAILNIKTFLEEQLANEIASGKITILA